MAENLYQDKSVDHIKEDVKNKFKDIEKGKWLPERDDQEIYSAAIDTINAYIQEIKATKEVYGPWALKEFSDLKKEFANTHNTLKGIKICTKDENKALINDVANKIDNAEKEVIKRLLFNNSNRSNAIAAQKSKEKHGEAYFTAENDGTLLFTKASNPVKIHDALEGLFDKNQNYQIDYNICTNPRIKAKMENFIGTGKCYISFNKTSKTYLIRNSQ